MGEVIGIIGAGTITDSYYIPALKRLGFSELQVCDVNERAATELADKYKVRQASATHLIESSASIIIATPPHTHYALLQQSLDAGPKTIICEKPFLYSASEAGAITRYARLQSSTLFVAHIRRCFSAIRLAKELIPSLELGKLKKASIMEGGRFSYKPKSDYTTHNPYGGVLLDTGSHVLDCFLYVTGLTQAELNCTVKEVRKDKAEPSHEVSYVFSLHETEVTLRLSRYEALANKIALHYEKGIVEVPLGLLPNIVVTANGQRKVYSPAGCLSYMTQAFHAELGSMLINKDEQTFGAADFMNLTHLLETLYHA